jgi:hypothetical protein
MVSGGLPKTEGCLLLRVNANRLPTAADHGRLQPHGAIYLLCLHQRVGGIFACVPGIRLDLGHEISPRQKFQQYVEFCGMRTGDATDMPLLAMPPADGDVITDLGVEDTHFRPMISAPYSKTPTPWSPDKSPGSPSPSRTGFYTPLALFDDRSVGILDAVADASSCERRIRYCD